MTRFRTLAVLAGVVAVFVCASSALAFDYGHRITTVQALWDSGGVGPQDITNLAEASGSDTTRTKTIDIRDLDWQAVTNGVTGPTPIAMVWFVAPAITGYVASAADTIWYTVESSPDGVNYRKIQGYGSVAGALGNIATGDLGGQAGATTSNGTVYQGALIADPDAAQVGLGGVGSNYGVALYTPFIRLKVIGDISGGIATAVRCYVSFPVRSMP